MTCGLCGLQTDYEDERFCSSCIEYVANASDEIHDIEESFELAPALGGVVDFEDQHMQAAFRWSEWMAKTPNGSGRIQVVNRFDSLLAEWGMKP